jgi:DNA-binding CsgD family transcriptional regulator
MNLKSAKKLAHALFTIYREHHKTDEEIDFMEGLEARLQHFESMAGLGQNIYYIFRTADRKVVYLKGNVQELLGYDNAYFQKKSMWMLIKLMKVSHLVAYLKAAVRFYGYLYSVPVEERLKAKGTAVFPLVNKEGKRKIVFQQWSVHKMDSHGNIVYTMNVITDVTHIALGVEPQIYIQIPGYIDDKLQVFNYFNDYKKLIKKEHKILTPAELNIVKYTAQGMTSKQIAHELKLSVHTVNNHKKNIMYKLGVVNMTEAIQQTKINYN